MVTASCWSSGAWAPTYGSSDRSVGAREMLTNPAFVDIGRLVRAAEVGRSYHLQRGCVGQAVAVFHRWEYGDDLAIRIAKVPSLILLDAWSIREQCTWTYSRRSVLVAAKLVEFFNSTGWALYGQMKGKHS